MQAKSLLNVLCDALVCFLPSLRMHISKRCCWEKPAHAHGEKLNHSEILKRCASHNPMWYVPT